MKSYRQQPQATTSGAWRRAGLRHGLPSIVGAATDTARAKFERHLRPLLAAVFFCMASGGGGAAFAQACTGLCLQQVTCAAGLTTSVSGTVHAPNGVDPLPGVLVYVPNAPVQAFNPGVACGIQVSGTPLVATTTGTDGTFVLNNVPAGANIPLVIQSGRWRRQTTIANAASCVNTAVNALNTRLPKNKTEGDIPRIAVVTGAADATECVLRKIGVDDAEFTQPAGAGRINLFLGNGAVAGASNPVESALWSSQSTLNQYDMTIMACEGSATAQTAADQQRVINYADAGGRILATHEAYTWFYNDAPFSSVAQWNGEQTSPGNQTASVNMAFPKGLQLAQWMQAIGATTTLGQIALSSLKKDQDGVNATVAQSWLTINTPPSVVQFTFDTPVGAQPAQQCGRVQFNEYHVETTISGTGLTFPNECNGGAMTAQEKLLEFSLFDLAGASLATINYDGNGNSGGSTPVDPASPFTYSSSPTVTVLGAGSLFKTGYSFTGWNTSGNGSGTAYAAGSTFTMSTAANLILRAQWTLASYPVTYDGNGSTAGSVPVDGANPHVYNTTVTVLANTGNLVRLGHTFAGWNTAADGSGTPYAATGAATFTMGPGSVALYAQWTVNSYTVTYSGNGNTGGSAPVDAGNPHAYNSTVTVPANTGSLVRTGYTFAGWNTAANGGGTPYAATGAATFTMGAGNATLYAQWAIGSYAVTYSGNGNTGGSAPVDGASPHVYNTTVTVLANTGTLVRTGLIFAGWNTAANGSGTPYAATGAATFLMGAGDLTLFAQWTTGNYTVTYSGNGNTGGSAPVDGASPYPFGATVTALANSGNLVRSGKVFSGWNTAANGSGIGYPATGAIAFTMGAGNLTLFALWNNPGCTLDVDGNGSIDALTDGLMLLRAMLGLTGTGVTNGAIGGGAPARTTWGLIQPYLNVNCGTNFAP